MPLGSGAVVGTVIRKVSASVASRSKYSTHNNDGTKRPSIYYLYTLRQYTAVVAIINSGGSKDPKALRLRRCLAFKAPC